MTHWSFAAFDRVRGAQKLSDGTWQIRLLHTFAIALTNRALIASFYKQNVIALMYYKLPLNVLTRRIANKIS